VAAAYLVICAAWLGYDRLRHLSASEPPLERSDRPVVDFVLVLAAAGGILLLGSVYRHGWLLPSSGEALGRLFWIVDNAIIYSPIAVVLFARRQGPQTIYLSRHRLPEKIALGLGLGVLAVTIYLALRGELAQLPACLTAAVEPGKLVNFVPIFLEGVAIAFAYVRLRWLVGMAAALAIPSILFAVAHIPGQVADESTLSTIGAFFVFNSMLCAAILWTVQRSRDVIWIGLAHYLMDIAIRAI
jgi:membrane protease YdiL (CAAX protease family)